MARQTPPAQRPSSVVRLFTHAIIQLVHILGELCVLIICGIFLKFEEIVRTRSSFNSVAFKIIGSTVCEENGRAGACILTLDEEGIDFFSCTLTASIRADLASWTCSTIFLGTCLAVGIRTLPGQLRTVAAFSIHSRHQQHKYQ